MTHHNKHLKYRPDIDGLRAIAVLLVVGFHAFPDKFKGGFIGVDIFFVLSGFLISSIIYKSLDKGEFSFREFYTKRIMRIFPTLIIVMTSCLTFGWYSLTNDEYKQLGKHITGGASFISNFLLWQESGYFDNASETKPLLHLWSLAIEEQFYIIWPFLLWFMWKNRLNYFVITVMATLVSFIFNVHEIKHAPVATFYSPLTRFWELMCGGLLAWTLIYRKEKLSNIMKKVDFFITSFFFKKQKYPHRNLLANFLAFIGLLLLLLGFSIIDKDFTFPGLWALIPVSGTTLVILASETAWINKKILSTKFLIWFGLISYPLYLLHWPILSFLHIVENDHPNRTMRITAVLISILLAWIITKWIEQPLRYGKQKTWIKVSTLCCFIIALAISGFFLPKTKKSETRTLDNLPIKRKGHEYISGSSTAWYRGQNNWLFLGNAYDATVKKLVSEIPPNKNNIIKSKKIFSDIAHTAAISSTKVVLLLGPNKSSVYPEYLPYKFKPTQKKYISFFLNSLKDVPNLTISNPTKDLINLKETEGILYWRTDTHWNDKGSFLAYNNFSKLLNLPVPQVKFKPASIHSGDLISISKFKEFPIHTGDNWNVVWQNKSKWIETKTPNKKKSAEFGNISIVRNQRYLSDKYIWVVGDSFTNSLRQYFNATFKEIHYKGHWRDKLKQLPNDLNSVDRKPDIIVIVRVERSF